MDETQQHMAEFEKLLEELKSLHYDKITEYGLARYTSPGAHEIMATFFDVDRKYIRLKNQIEKGHDLKQLRETFMDVASYGIMGMQIIDLMSKKEKKTRA